VVGGRTVLLVLCAVSLWASLWPVGVLVIVIVPVITTTVTVTLTVTIVWDTHNTANDSGQSLLGIAPVCAQGLSKGGMSERAL
jgi:hypothetical protein